jgi:hypothetical protein
MMKFSSTLNAAAIILVVAVASTPTTANTATSSISDASSLRGVPTTRDLFEQERIVGGDQSKEGEFPYYVGMGGW